MKTQIYVSLIGISLAHIVTAQSWNGMPGLSGVVYEIVPHEDNVYVGGDFLNAGGLAEADHAARWDGCDWYPIGPGLNGIVRAIAIIENDVYVGGDFSLPYPYIARWDGTQWNSVGSDLAGPVHAIVSDDTGIYVGGGTWNVYGYVAGWKNNDWMILGSSHERVHDLVINGTDLYAGGPFTDFGSNPNADGVARWDGELWNNLGSGISYDFLNYNVWDMLVHQNELYVGGPFGNAGGNPEADGIAKWDGQNWISLGDGPGGFLGLHALASFEGSIYTTVGAGWNGTDGIYRWDLISGEWELFQLTELGADDPLLVLTSDAASLYIGGYGWITRWGEQDDCSPSGLRDKTSNSTTEINAYPNPAQDVINYSLGDMDVSQMHLLTVTDVHGKMVMTKQTHEQEVNISDLLEGVYFLKVKSETKTGVSKIVKQ